MKTQDVIGNKYKALEKDYRAKFESNKYLILRLDGKAFHSFTKGMKKPFDERLYEIFKETLKYLCETVDGVKIGYYQSDEISLILFNDSPKINKQYWFDNKVEKILTIATSICTAKFNSEYNKFGQFGNKEFGFFDARGFVVDTLDEVQEYLEWRVNDSIKNSVYLYAFDKVKENSNPTKSLMNKSVKEKIDLLKNEYGVDYYSFESKYRKGIFYSKEYTTFVVKKEQYPEHLKEDKVVTRRKFKLHETFDNVGDIVDHFRTKGE